MKPRVDVRCAAAASDGDYERTVELSFPEHRDDAGLPAGALLTLYDGLEHPVVCLYRVDATVKVVVPEHCTLVQDGLTGRVVEHGDLLELLGAALVALRTEARGLGDVALRLAVQRYALDLRGTARSVLALALRNELAWHAAQGTHPDTLGWHEWRALLARLEAE